MEGSGAGRGDRRWDYVAFAPAAAAQDPGQVGSWSALQTYPVVPVSMGVTPDGKIVAWDQANSGRRSSGRFR